MRQYLIKIALSVKKSYLKKEVKACLDPSFQPSIGFTDMKT